jgi:GGDEF domain-containing protein
VADAPVDALLERPEDVAKGWLLALLEDAPLEAAQRILAAHFATDGPRLCEAVLRALVSDADLHQLEEGGAVTPLASRVRQLVGAPGPADTMRALDALHGVIWAALSEELRHPEPSLVADLAERLSLVTEQLRAAALRHVEIQGDERTEPAFGPVHLAPGPLEPEGPTTVEQAPPVSWPPPARPAGDARARTLWMDALTDEIRGAGGAPLALLLAELEDADRVSAAESEARASATFSEFAQAVRSVVRREDILVAETETRAWIIARNTEASGARALGARITAAVGARPPWRGASLTASVGIAVLGEDGRTADELVAVAEEGRFVAAAAGVGVIKSAPEKDPGA